MKSIFGVTCLVVLGVILGCAKQTDQGFRGEFPQAVTITVTNETDMPRTSEAVVLDVSDLKAKASTFNANAFVVLDKGIELASQASDLNGDGQMDQVIFICDFKPKEVKKIEVRYAEKGKKIRDYPKKTQAELSCKFGGKFIINKEGRPEYEGGAFRNVEFLRVPPQHTDHTWFIRYEGPGWESDKIGYRFYLDWRNATDIFGKKIPDMVLQNVGQDGFDSYHAMSDWGMDILKVGESLGIGSIAMWQENKAERVSKTDSVTCEIVRNGPVQSIIRTKYFGWKVGSGVYNLVSDLSIHAGSRLTKHQVIIEGNPDNLCTGIVKLPETHVLSPDAGQGNWTYFATYGKQSLAEDSLGIAVLYRTADFVQLTADEYSHVIVLTPEKGHLTYYFLAAWEQEPGGIRTEKAFSDYLSQVLRELDSPITVKE